MSEQRYRLELSVEQAQALTVACEVLARLGMNQLRYALDWLPTKIADYSDWNATVDRVERDLSQFVPVRFVRDPLTERAWSLYTLIRHRLAWDRAVRGGVIPNAQAPRKWPEMMAVDYDDPHTYRDEPLAATIEAVDGGERGAHA